MKKNKCKKLLFYIFFLIILLIFFTYYFGSKYLKRLNNFINENNSIIIKNEISKFISQNEINDIKNIYKLNYNSDNEITNTDINVNYINSYLSIYIKNLEDRLNSAVYYKYIDKYFKKINVGKNYYVLFPFGSVYDNPFLYNVGPKIIMSYDFINSIQMKVKVEVKEYGLNNVLVNLYLVLEVEQNVLKPILKVNNSYSYEFLLDSSIIYGRLSNYLGTNYTKESNAVLLN